jgi:hypothetical protein
VTTHYIIPLPISRRAHLRTREWSWLPPSPLARWGHFRAATTISASLRSVLPSTGARGEPWAGNGE